MAQENIFLKADSLYADGVEAYNTNNLANAIKSFISCDSINKVYNRPMPYFSSNAPQWASRCLYLFGDEDAAKSLGDDFRLEPVDQRLTIESDSLGWLASECLNNQDYEGMYQYALKAKPIEERILGKDHYYCLNTNYIIGLHSLVNGDAKSMIPYMEQYASVMSGLDKHYPMLIEIYRQLIDAYGTEDLIEAGIGLHQYLRDEYNNDETIWPRLAEKLSGLTYNIADTLRQQGKADDAIKYALWGLDYSTFDNEGYNINRWLILSLLSDIYEAIDINKSIVYTKEKIQVSEKLDNIDRFLSDYSTLSLLYAENRDFNSAIEVLDSLCLLCSSHKDIDKSMLYKNLFSIAFNYRDINDHQNVKNIAERIKNLLEINGDTVSEDYCVALKLLAYSHRKAGNYEAAKSYRLETLGIISTLFGKNSWEYANYLNDYASSLEMPKTSQTEILKLKAESRQIMENDASCPFYVLAGIYQSLATTYSDMQLKDSAQYYYDKSLSLSHQNGDNGLSQSYKLWFTIMSHYINGDLEYAQTHIYEWFEMFKSEMCLHFVNLTQEQRIKFWNNWSWIKSSPLLISMLSSDEVSHIVSYNSLLFFKGIMLGMDISIDKLLHSIDNKTLLYEYNRLKNKDADSQVFIEENKIVHKIKEYGDISASLTLTWKNVQDCLQNNDIAVEFATTDIEDGRYLAFVINKNSNSPNCYVLDHVNDILYENENNSIYSSLWEQIIKGEQLSENSNIYFSPDGILCQLPIEYCLTTDGCLMNTKYNMYRVSSTRELCNLVNKGHTDYAILYGGLKYDTSTSIMQEESNKYCVTRSGDNLETLLSSSKESNRFGFYNLPETKFEVDSIAEIINHAGSTVKIYTDTKGNEESFKSLSGNAPSILHIATHGYFLNKTIEEIESQQKVQNIKFHSTSDTEIDVIDYSMQRAGLVFSGATNRLKGNQIPEGVDDGLLTAKEIAQLDLHNVDLAVLSACNTGAGEITNDGVAGLQRGFKNAGVNSILMSLWKVDDKATQMLMVEFYRNLMSGKSKVESLRNAQQYLRNYTQDGEKIYSDPEYWAAFILLDALD